MSAPPADFVAPSHKTADQAPRAALPCPFTAQGMLQPANVQPPPMFGPRGATIPPKHLVHTYAARGGGGSHERGGRGGAARPSFRPRGDNPHQKPRFQNNNHKPSPRFTQPPSTTFHHSPSADGIDSLLPRSRKFNCEPCDREFGTADELAGHRAQHQRCTAVDGCPFEGHAQLVAAHVQQQHSTGVYDRIKNLTSPEEIERWREERRRRYPSKQNVALRQQIQEVRQQRGERLAQESKARFGQKADRRPELRTGAANQTSGNNERNGKEANVKSKKRRKRKGPGRDAAAADAAAKATEQIEPEVMNGTLHMFKGTAAMERYKRPRVKVVNALSGLLGAYGSDEEDDEESSEKMSSSSDDEAPSNAEPATVVEVVEPQECQSIVQSTSEQQSTMVVEEIVIESNANMDDDDPDNGPPEEDIVQRISTLPEIDDTPAALPTPTIGDAPKSQPVSNKRPQRSAATNSGTIAPKRSKPTSILDLSRRYRNQNTMLEKLLQKDIRHERNVLLQCVRYVVENRFFGVGQEQQTPKTE